MISESGNYFLSVGYDPDQRTGSNFPLDNPITLQDGEELEIALTQVNYPQTFLNVRREHARFVIEIEFGFPFDHLNPATNITDAGLIGVVGGNLTSGGDTDFQTFEGNWTATIQVPIPKGAYSHSELVDLINSRMLRAWEELAKPGNFLYNGEDLYRQAAFHAEDPFTGTTIQVIFDSTQSTWDQQYVGNPQANETLVWTLPITPARSATSALANVLPVPYLQAFNRKTLVKVGLPRSSISTSLNSFSTGALYPIPSPYVSQVKIFNGDAQSVQALLGFCGDSDTQYSEIFTFFGSDIIQVESSILGGYIRDGTKQIANGERKLTYDIRPTNPFNVGSATFERSSACQNQLAHRFLHIGVSQLMNGTNFVGRHLPVPSCALSVPLLEPAPGGGPMLTYSVRHPIFHKVRSPFAVLNVQLYIDDEQIVRPTEEEKVNILFEYRILQTGGEIVQNHGLTLPPVAGYRALSSNNDPLEIAALNKRPRQN